MKTKTLLCTAAAIAMTAGAVSAQNVVAMGSGKGSAYFEYYAPSVTEAANASRGWLDEFSHIPAAGSIAAAEYCASYTSGVCVAGMQGDSAQNAVVQGLIANGDLCFIRGDLSPESPIVLSAHRLVKDYPTFIAAWGSGRVSLAISEGSTGSIATAELLRESAGLDPAKAKIETFQNWNSAFAAQGRNDRLMVFSVRFTHPLGWFNTQAREHDLTAFGVFDRNLANLTHADGSRIYAPNTAIPYMRDGLGFAETPGVTVPVALYSNCPDNTEFPADTAAFMSDLANAEIDPTDNLPLKMSLVAGALSLAQDYGADSAWDAVADKVGEASAVILD